MNATPEFIRPAIFLDTNAIQYMNTYLERARKYVLPPYGTRTMHYREIKDRLKAHFPERIVGHLMKGCNTLAFLERQAGAEDGPIIYVSHLGELEALHNFLEGQAHFRMAQEGVSYRSRQRLSELSELVLKWLTLEDYSAATERLGRMFDALERQIGIRIDYVETGERLPAILKFAKLLQEKVFLDVTDCWMYGCALAVQADQLITFDGYFQTVVKNIYDSQQPLWRQLKETMLTALGEVFAGATEAELTVPRFGLPSNITPGLWNEACA